MTTLHVDFETRSAVDLKKAGVHAYAEAESTDVWCMAYAFDDEPVDIWTPGEPLPPRIVAHIKSGGRLAAHNAAFERVIWHYVCAPRYGWPEPSTQQWQCTMMMAAAMSLPQSLENMLGALGTDIQKDMAGRRLMLTMTRPRKVYDAEWKFPPGVEAQFGDRNFWTVLKDGTRILWWGDADRRARLYAYCGTDIDAERAGGKRLVRLRPSEQQLWQLDQRINDRGVYVDLKLARKMKAIVAFLEERLDREMSSVTGGEVTACSNVGQLKVFVAKAGFATDSLAKDSVEELLVRHDLPADVRRALELRQTASRASVAKINALLNGVCKDGFARGLLQFLAANSGRWGGRRFQPQNIRRPSPEMEGWVDKAIEIILKHEPGAAVALLEACFDLSALTLLSDCLRGLLRAAPGKKLRVADFSNIEGRVIAWLAGETWKLDAFRAYDRGEGPDLYKVTAGDLLGKKPEDVTKAERQALGKVPELASAYEGGHGAYIKMGAVGETLARIVSIVKGRTTPEAWAATAKRFDTQHGLTVDEWVALRLTIDGWRAKHPAIKQYWRDLNDAALEAVRFPGDVVRVRDTLFRVVGSFLWMQIPSGRAICFPYPQIVSQKMPWKNDDGHPVYKDVVAFKGENSLSRKWETQYLYGGKLANYVTQGTARDVMAEAMLRVEAADYPVILTVHDEVVAETAEDFGSLAEFERLMTALPPWATGLPVTAKGFESERYRKD